MSDPKFRAHKRCFLYLSGNHCILQRACCNIKQYLRSVSSSRKTYATFEALRQLEHLWQLLQKGMEQFSKPVQLWLLAQLIVVIALPALKLEEVEVDAGYVKWRKNLCRD